MQSYQLHLFDSISFLCRFVIYISTLCGNANQGKETLRAAIAAIMSLIVRERPDDIDQNINADDKDSALLWSALYIQELSMVRYNWSFAS